MIASRAFILLLAALPAPADSPLAGRWINPSGSVVMLIAPCGDTLCGTVEWASDKAKADARRGTPELVGVKLLTEVRETRSGYWSAQLFVPDAKITAPARLQLMDAARLQVSGCVGRTKICKSQIWGRAAEGAPAR